jgi:hypothetical protein
MYDVPMDVRCGILWQNVVYIAFVACCSVVLSMDV